MESFHCSRGTEVTAAVPSLSNGKLSRSRGGSSEAPQPTWGSIPNCPLGALLVGMGLNIDPANQGAERAGASLPNLGRTLSCLLGGRRRRNKCSPPAGTILTRPSEIRNTAKNGTCLHTNRNYTHRRVSARAEIELLFNYNTHEPP